jgi:hypothetical protein
VSMAQADDDPSVFQIRSVRYGAVKETSARSRDRSRPLAAPR